MTPPTDTTGGRVQVLSDEQLGQIRERWERDTKWSSWELMRAVETAVIAALSATPLDVEDAAQGVIARATATLEPTTVLGERARAHLQREVADAIRIALATQAAHHGTGLDRMVVGFQGERADYAEKIREAQQRAEAAEARVRELERRCQNHPAVTRQLCQVCIDHAMETGAYL